MKNQLLFLAAFLFISTWVNAQIAPSANNIFYLSTSIAGGNATGDSWTNSIPQLTDALKYAKLHNNYTVGCSLLVFVPRYTYTTIVLINTSINNQPK